MATDQHKKEVVAFHAKKRVKKQLMRSKGLLHCISTRAQRDRTPLVERWTKLLKDLVDIVNEYLFYDDGEVMRNAALYAKGHDGDPAFMFLNNCFLQGESPWWQFTQTGAGRILLMLGSNRCGAGVRVMRTRLQRELLQVFTPLGKARDAKQSHVLCPFCGIRWDERIDNVIILGAYCLNHRLPAHQRITMHDLLPQLKSVV